MPDRFDPAEERWAKLAQDLEELYDLIWRLERQWHDWPWLAWRSVKVD